MADIKYFNQKLLELFSREKQCYRNIFGCNQERIKQILGKAPTEEDLICAQRSFSELRAKGLIFDADGEGWFVASKLGKAALAVGTFDSSTGLRLLEFVSDSRILRVSEQAFDAGKFSDAVFNATKMLEVAIREKANLGAEVLGKDVAIKAFNPQGGKLSLPMCVLDAEKQGAMQLLAGSISFLKNPESHRYTTWIDYPTAVKALQSIEFQLMLVDTAVAST